MIIKRRLRQSVDGRSADSLVIYLAPSRYVAFNNHGIATPSSVHPTDSQQPVPNQTMASLQHVTRMPDVLSPTCESGGGIARYVTSMPQADDRYQCAVSTTLI